MRTAAAAALDWCEAEPASDRPPRLPLVLRAASPDADLAAALARDARALEPPLLRHGAILFRGFPVTTSAAFARCAEAVCGELFGDYGDLPRQTTTERVYDSTPYPADQSILFHHEGSHTGAWPLKQWFFCVIPPAAGGRTPLADGRVVLRELDPAVREEFQRKGLIYRRTFTPGLDVSWQAFFRTSDRAVAEREAGAQGFACEWKAGSRLQLRRASAAIVRHPRCGDDVFFNQILLHHHACLPASTRESLLALFDEADLPRSVSFGDGTVIPHAVVDHVQRAYDRAKAGFDWQSHDVLLVDNMLVAHGRDPFVAPRKIAVAMGEMIRSETLRPA